jgi:hypothetical protein
VTALAPCLPLLDARMLQVILAATCGFLPSRASCWVVISSRRGLVSAGPDSGRQGAQFRLAATGLVWLPSWRAGRRSPLLVPLPPICERCRVRAEPGSRARAVDCSCGAMEGATGRVTRRG